MNYRFRQRLARLEEAHWLDWEMEHGQGLASLLPWWSREGRQTPLRPRLDTDPALTGLERLLAEIASNDERE